MKVFTLLFPVFFILFDSMLIEGRVLQFLFPFNQFFKFSKFLKPFSARLSAVQDPTIFGFGAVDSLIQLIVFVVGSFDGQTSVFFMVSILIFTF